MNKLQEYLKLLPAGLKNIDKVLEGYLNEVKKEFNYLPVDAQEEIVRRRLICESCPFFSLNLEKEDKEYRELYEKPFKSLRKGERFCGICGCPEKVKTASLSSNCGLESYNKSHEKQIPLKWTAYENHKS